MLIHFAVQFSETRMFCRSPALEFESALPATASQSRVPAINHARRGEQRAAASSSEQQQCMPTWLCEFQRVHVCSVDAIATGLLMLVCF